jgi:hypothetical protein
MELQSNTIDKAKLTWNPHVAQAIAKSNKALHTICMIKNISQQTKQRPF